MHFVARSNGAVTSAAFIETQHACACVRAQRIASGLKGGGHPVGGFVASRSSAVGCPLIAKCGDRRGSVASRRPPMHCSRRNVCTFHRVSVCYTLSQPQSVCTCVRAGHNSREIYGVACTCSTRRHHARRTRPPPPNERAMATTMRQNAKLSHLGAARTNNGLCAQLSSHSVGVSSEKK